MFTIGSVTAVDSKSEAIPDKFALLQNFPNPFNPETCIVYQIPTSSFVHLAIYNLLGEKVKQMVEEQKQPGEYSVIWDGKDDDGKRVSSGIYIYQLCVEEKVTFNRRLLFLK